MFGVEMPNFTCICKDNGVVIGLFCVNKCILARFPGLNGLGIIEAKLWWFYSRWNKKGKDAGEKWRGYCPFLVLGRDTSMGVGIRFCDARP